MPDKQHAATPVAATQDETRDARAKAWSRIPGELRYRPQWAMAAADKSPCRPTAPRKLVHASSTDPRTWSSFDTAASAAYDLDLHIGFMLHESDPFACIDFDVKDDTTQAEMDWFWQLALEWDCYAELSRSGKGLHLWCQGWLEKGIKRKPLEIYTSERFIITTGEVRVPAPIRNRSNWLDYLATLLGGGTPTVETTLSELPAVEPDVAVYHRARPKDVVKFDALWRGGWRSLGCYPSQSEADEALLSYLIHATPSNEQVRRIFRLSGLGQRKKAQRDQYLNYTIKRFRAEQDRVRVMQGNFA